MEIEAVVGAVVELGERLGVAMPATRAVYACVKMLDAQRTRTLKDRQPTSATSPKPGV
jgi:ketopantoate reductase